MATTSPDNIWTPDAGDAYALTTDLAATADTIQDALTSLRTQFPFEVADSAARDTRFPSPAQGDRVWRLDKQWEEAYFAAYNAGTNPQGASPAGWYPISGALPSADIRNHDAIFAIPNGISTVITSYTVGTLGHAKDVTVTSGTLVITQPGVYRIEGSWVPDVASSTGIRLAQVSLNNALPDTTSMLSYGPPQVGSSTAYSIVPFSPVPKFLAAGDVIRIGAWQNSTASVNLGRTSAAAPILQAISREHNSLRVRYIGPRTGA